jgi:hypothetical protein
MATSEYWDQILLRAPTSRPKLPRKVRPLRSYERHNDGLYVVSSSASVSVICKAYLLLGTTAAAEFRMRGRYVWSGRNDW